MRPSSASKRVDVIGKWRCEVATDLALVRRKKAGAIPRLVRRALDLADTKPDCLTTSDSMGTAIAKQCQRVVDSAARKEAGEDSQDPQELYVQTSRLLDVLRAGVRRAAGESAKRVF